KALCLVEDIDNNFIFLPAGKAMARDIAEKGGWHIVFSLLEKKLWQLQHFKRIPGKRKGTCG
ncbi:MAG TPA: hypothetical protein VH396_07130, partial [Chitinophagaceae bacterium]